jgi:hypothetical protein
MENLKIHDCVVVVRNHKNEDKYYYGGRTPGVIMELGKEKFAVKTACGQTEEFAFVQEEYTLEVLPLSEVEFANLITKEIKDQERHLDEKIEELETVEQWQKDFRMEVSFLGKLMRFIKSEAPNIAK